jgi:hypothetical protein
VAGQAFYMKLISSVVRPDRLETVKQALLPRRNPSSSKFERPQISAQRRSCGR